MKYCPKCGTQLTDDAAFCSKCGTALSQEAITLQSSNIENTDKRKKIKTKSTTCIILMILALLISIFAGVMFYEGECDALPSQELFLTLLLWATLSVATFVLGVLALMSAEKKGQTAFTFIYLFVNLITIIIFIIRNPDWILFMFCLFGLVMYVPAILNIIAAVKIFHIAIMKGSEGNNG